MGELQQAVPEFLLTPVTVVALAGFLLVLPLINGFSMQWAVNLAGGGPVGFFRGLGTAGAAAATAGVTHLLASSCFGDASVWITIGYSTVGAIVAIAVVVPCNPVSAGVAYVLYSLLSALGIFGAAAVLAVTLYFTADSETLASLQTLRASGEPETIDGAGRTSIAGRDSASTSGGAAPRSGSARASGGEGGRPAGSSAFPAAGDPSSARRSAAGPETTGRSERRTGRAHGLPNSGGIRTNPYVTD